MPNEPNQQLREDSPRGLLFILDDPDYRHQKTEEQNFILKMSEAGKEGRLIIPYDLDTPPTRH